MNEAGRRVREQYADTGGFTDHVFAVTSLLGYQFVPRIRDLPSKRLHVFDLGAVANELRALIGSKARSELIAANWPDVLRSAATMVTGAIAPSQLLRKFASYPRQHDLAVALREIGCVERTLFIIEWVLDPEMRRRAHIGLNKGESRHALKKCASYRAPGRNPRPFQRRPTLPDGWAQSAGRDRHLLKYRAPGRGGSAAKARRIVGRA